MLVLNRGVFEERPDGGVAFSRDLIECENVTAANGRRPSSGGNGKVAPLEIPHPAAGSRAR